MTKSDYLIFLSLRKQALTESNEEKIRMYDRIIEQMILADEISDDEFNAGKYIQ